jgi:hypothetical protein
MSAISAHRAELEAIARSNGAAGPGLQSIDGGGMAVTVDAKGKLVLPPAPPHDDPAGLCAWLTTVLALNPGHPITGGVRQGLAGPEGHVELRRADAQPLRFEPASQIDSPQRIHEALNWRMIPTDGAVPAFKGEHCRQIAHVIRMLCGWADRMTEADEAGGIVGCYLGAAQAIEGHTTYGTVPQRYEAATALQRGIDDDSGRSVGPQKYLLDSSTGEYVVRVADLSVAARVYTGGGLPHGWLDARMEALGWERIQLSGYSEAGRDGRRTGHHARCNAYRGHLPHHADVGEVVNT